MPPADIHSRTGRSIHLQRAHDRARSLGSRYSDAAINLAVEKNLTAVNFRLVHIPALDGLRGIAILGVVAYHAQWLSGGYIGVDIFFTLSGFLITSLLLQEWKDEGRINLPAFYKRRLLRLFPALFILVVVAGIYERLYISCPARMSFSERAYYALTYYSNWLWAFSDTVTIPTCSFYALWTLAIEEQFYLVWPPILTWLLSRHTNMKSITLILCAALIGSLTVRLYLWSNGAPLWRIIAGTDTHADPIIFGCLAAVAAFSLPADFWRERRHLISLCAPLALLGLFVLMVRLTPGVGTMYTVTFTCLGSLTAIAILGISVSPVGILTANLRAPALVYIGRTSYGLYLWHSTIGAYFDAHFPSAPFVMRISVVIIFTLGSYYYIELPFLKLKKRG